MGSVVLDASAVIAVLDPADAHHAEAVAALEATVDRDQNLMIAASAYAEALVHPLREKRGDLVDDFLDRLGVEIVVLDRPLARSAAGLRAKHGDLRFPDALVLATAEEADAQLLTFDFQLRRLAESRTTD